MQHFNGPGHHAVTLRQNGARYCVPRFTGLITKIAQIGRRKSEAEILWVLGATVEVPNQLTQDLATDGEKQGIATLVLDWNDQELPALCIVLANAGDDIGAWVANRTEAEVSEAEIERQLLRLKTDEAAKLRWESLQAGFCAPLWQAGSGFR